jgi:hypothetical protein
MRLSVIFMEVLFRASAAQLSSTSAEIQIYLVAPESTKPASLAERYFPEEKNLRLRAFDPRFAANLRLYQSFSRFRF